MSIVTNSLSVHQARIVLHGSSYICFSSVDREYRVLGSNFEKFAVEPHVIQVPHQTEPHD